MTAPWIGDEEVTCAECEGDGYLDTDGDVPWECDEIECEECKGTGSLEWCWIDQCLLRHCDDEKGCAALMAAVLENRRADEAVFRASRKAMPGPAIVAG